MDETLDVLAAHGLAGFTGILFIGFVAQAGWNGDLGEGLFYGESALLGDQALAALVAPLYAFGATFMMLKLMSFAFRLRVTEREEAIGLDVTQHGEEAYVSGEGAILIEPHESDRRAQRVFAGERRCSEQGGQTRTNRRNAAIGASGSDPFRGLGQPLGLELAQEALEEAAVALLVAQDRDHHVLRDPVDAVGHLDDPVVVLDRAGLGLDHALDHVHDVGLLVGRLEV